MAATGEIYQVVYQGLIGGSTCENVVHYRALTPLVTDAAIATAAERFWFFAQVMQSSDYVYSQMVIKRMTPIQLDASIVFPVTVAHGAVGSAGVNNQVAMVFTLRTGTAGKSHRGRIYLGGIPAAYTGADGNTISGTGIGASTAMATGLLAEFGPSGTSTALRLGIYSRSIGGIHPFSLAGWQQVNGIDAQAVFGAQRRRRLGRGI